MGYSLLFNLEHLPLWPPHPTAFPGASPPIRSHNLARHPPFILGLCASPYGQFATLTKPHGGATYLHRKPQRGIAHSGNTSLKTPRYSQKKAIESLKFQTAMVMAFFCRSIFRKRIPCLFRSQQVAPLAGPLLTIQYLSVASDAVKPPKREV